MMAMAVIFLYAIHAPMGIVGILASTISALIGIIFIDSTVPLQDGESFYASQKFQRWSFNKNSSWQLCLTSSNPANLEETFENNIKQSKGA